MFSLDYRIKVVLCLASLGLMTAGPAAASLDASEGTPAHQLIEDAVAKVVANDFQRLFGQEPGETCVQTHEAAYCLSPDTPPERVEELLRSLLIYGGDDRYQLSGGRWSVTAIDGYTGTQGNPVNLTYSFLPDGTWIPGSSEPGSPSNLYATLNAQFGSEATWKALFAEHFDHWGRHIGITYTEVSDDGASFPDAVGLVGSRGDSRIGAHYIDGGSNVLAYNYFPNFGGDMVLDSSENWGNAGNDYRFFRNIVMHEHGHGHGLGHVTPENCSKLMEAFLCTNFLGPQDDDIRGGMRNYGDFLENNDNAAEATDLGVFTGEEVIATPSLTNSLDHDWYKFTLENGGTLDVTLHPVGFAYQVDGNVVFTDEIIDLKFELRGEPSGGVVLIAVNETSYGVDEVLNDYELTAGDYWIHVARHAGTSDVQRYDLTLNIEPAPTAVPDGDRPLAGMGLGVYPNPFNPKTTAHFYVGEAGPVTLNVYNVAGGLTRSIETRADAAGWMDVVWNGLDEKGQKAPSGIYFMRARSGERSETVRAVLLK